MNLTLNRAPVTIVDLGMQNIQSVVTALELVGALTRVISKPDAIKNAGLVVVPGVGSFANAARKLVETGLREALRDHVLERQRPLLGLCLGMQLLADMSDEHGVNAGLGLIPAKVVLLKEQPPAWRVPNIGWREVQLTPNNVLLPHALNARAFYHVHSYHMICEDPSHVAGLCDFGEQRISSIVHRGTVAGTQFHPEKSQDAGLDLLHAILQKLA